MSCSWQTPARCVGLPQVGTCWNYGWGCFFPQILETCWATSIALLQSDRNVLWRRQRKFSSKDQRKSYNSATWHEELATVAEATAGGSNGSGRYHEILMRFFPFLSHDVMMVSECFWRPWPGWRCIDLCHSFVRLIIDIHILINMFQSFMHLSFCWAEPGHFRAQRTSKETWESRPQGSARPGVMQCIVFFLPGFFLHQILP